MEMEMEEETREREEGDERKREAEGDTERERERLRGQTSGGIGQVLWLVVGRPFLLAVILRCCLPLLFTLSLSSVSSFLRTVILLISMAFSF